MKREKLPHMPLWVYDIDADEDCALMSSVEFGIYMRLLIRQWIEGSVPDSPIAIGKLIRERPRVIAEWLHHYGDKFPVGDDGRRRNPRLAEERESIKSKVAALRANGKRGGRPKKQTDGESETNCETKEKPNGLPNGLPNGFIRASESVSVSGFVYGSEGGAGGNRAAYRCTQADAEALYALYPRKQGRRKAIQAIQAAVKHMAEAGDEAPLETLREAVVAYAESPAGRSPPPGSEDFRPHPATWFNSERYYDDRENWQRANGGAGGSGNRSTSARIENPAAQRRAAEAERLYQPTQGAALPIIDVAGTG